MGGLARDTQVASSKVRIRTQASVTAKSVYKSGFLTVLFISPSEG